MKTCSVCHILIQDSVRLCPKCGADLRELSEAAVTLKRLVENPHVRSIRIAVPEDACPICHELQGTYAKSSVPALPVQGCSHPNGCRAFYEPLFDEVYP